MGENWKNFKGYDDFFYQVDDSSVFNPIESIRVYYDPDLGNEKRTANMKNTSSKKKSKKLKAKDKKKKTKKGYTDA